MMISFDLIYPDQSAIPYRSMTFPDGQPHIKMDVGVAERIDRKEPLRIFTRLNNANDLLLALLVKNSLDYLGFEHIELHVSYLLAGRMDRVMLDGEPFSLKVVASMINQGQFKKVLLFDPHSEVSTALIDRSYAVANHAFVRDALKDYASDHSGEALCLVSPDAGALKKIHKLAQALGIGNVVECMKERDVRTGALTKFNAMTDGLHGQTCFIVDDICDGGGTFAGTANVLKEKGAGRVNLIVSHGIFSKGTVIEDIDEVYTTDSYRKVEGVNCFSIGRYI
ncbi:MAG TPA: phosphoribosyltransferase family protein [Puia sp.]|jgi:ribose-phosphate pyrophosphokinase|nr:phosphoribosyltransferase family protein [Puia sp.]